MIQDGAVSAFAEIYRGDDVSEIAREIVANRAAFPGAKERDDVLAEYGVPSNTSPDDLVAQVAADRELLARVASTCLGGSSSDVKLAKKLHPLTQRPIRFEDLGQRSRTSFFLDQKQRSRSAPNQDPFPRSPPGASLGSDADALDELMDRIAEARPLRLGLLAADRTHRLRRFAHHLIPAYEAEKQARGWLDFDDLIERVRVLLHDRAAADWVRYRLDGRIDHVLVDEAQDTSPSQWQVIEGLTAEFGAGEGARDIDRRLFVVGDKKQSIYSFQGADAEMFDEMRAAFADRLRHGGGLQELELLHSFRSSPAVLQVVDQVFEGDAGEGLGSKTRHLAFFNSMPGRVDLWPVVEKEANPDPAPWFDPVDMPAPGNPADRLSEGIAELLHQKIHVDKETLPTQDGGRRPMTEGDVLILVQGRSGANDLFFSLIRSLKAKGLRVAGADRLKIASELVVRDLQSLLKFLSLPEDDLSLATVLRSPLFGWSEDDLYRLAANRPDRMYLWQALRDTPDHEETTAVLTDLRDKAEFLRPYDLLERVLVVHRGRSKLVARLGEEATDGIDELLNQALAYERAEVPSLTGFLNWLEGEAVEVKRQADSAEGMIQVMTVHGAKGLERPVVILPDTLRKDQGARGTVLVDPDGHAHWRTSRDDAPDKIAKMLDTAAGKERRERQRLLYVAMTRAKNWLIVAGAGQEPKTGTSWYGTVRSGLERSGAVATETPFGEGLRLATGDWNAGDVIAAPPDHVADPALPDWAIQPAEARESVSGTRAPSDLGGSKAVPGEPGAGTGEADAEAALKRGRQVHLLLEHLPGVAETARGQLAVDLLSFGEDEAGEDEARALSAEVGKLLDAPSLKRVFGPDALAEVDVTAALPELGDNRIHGAIDRLVLAEDRVLAVDFKTNRVVPNSVEDVPEGLLRQMGAYLAALRQIYPDRTADVALLWTVSGQLMHLPHEIVMQALARTPAS